MGSVQAQKSHLAYAKALLGLHWKTPRIGGVVMALGEFAVGL